MKITANVAYNADKFVNKNYKNPGTSEAKIDDSESSKSEDNSFVSQLIETIFGKSSNTDNTKVKSRNDYTPASYDSSTTAIFDQFMDSTMSKSKFFISVNYKKHLKDQEEFEKMLLKLKDVAMKDKDAGEYTLNLFKSFVKDAEKTSKSPAEVISKVMDSIRSFIKNTEADIGVGPNKDDGSSLAARAKDILKSALGISDGSLDKIGSFAENSVGFADDASAQNFFDTINTKIKMSKKYNYLKSTRNYLKNYKNAEEFNQKMAKISDLKYSNSADVIGSEVENLISEIKSSSRTNSDKSNGNDHVTDFNRLNADVYSPAFA